jgi:uncharacterized protein
MGSKFVFDPAKDAANRAKHGVSLSHGERVFDDPELILIPSMRVEDGEERYKAVGLRGGQLWTVVHVYRGDTIRLISVRRSNRGEQREYRSD